MQALQDDPSMASRVPETTAESELADVALAAAGDTRAFERLYRSHVGRVHSLARRMMGSEDVDDVTQDIFVRAWQKLDSFRGAAAFGTWLHRLAVNVILAQRKQRGIRWHRYPDTESLSISPARVPDSVEDRVDFERAVVKLPAGAREVFVLHDVEGYKHNEIGEMLGISVGTSKAQLHRARMSLRRYVER